MEREWHLTNKNVNLGSVKWAFYVTILMEMMSSQWKTISPSCPFRMLRTRFTLKPLDDITHMLIMNLSSISISRRQCLMMILPKQILISISSWANVSCCSILPASWIHCCWLECSYNKSKNGYLVPFLLAQYSLVFGQEPSGMIFRLIKIKKTHLYYMFVFNITSYLQILLNAYFNQIKRSQVLLKKTSIFKYISLELSLL